MPEEKSEIGERGLVGAYLRATRGNWAEVGWSQVRDWTPEHGLLWVHLDREEQSSRDYIQRTSGIDTIIQEALLADVGAAPDQRNLLRTRLFCA